MLNRNGTPPASRTSSGAGVFQPPRTEFLPDLPTDTWQAILYQLSRQHLILAPIVRWIYAGLFALALIWPLLDLPGRWWGTASALAGASALWLVIRAARRRSFVRFTLSALPAVTPARLPPSYKAPVYVTGWLSVQAKVRQFASLPGYYRTFATREHALLCQARPRRFWALATWPSEEEGLWYAFFSPTQVDQVDAGELAFGRRSLPALAIQYRPAPTTDGKDGRHPARATLYLAFTAESERSIVLADLLVERSGVQQPGDVR